MRSWANLFGVVILFVIILLATQFILPSETVTTFNLVATSLFAALSAFGSLATIREMRRDRLDRSKPFIFVDFEMTGTHLVNWVIQNIGGGPAMNVKFKFDPVPINYSGNPLTDLAFFQRPIPAMMPGFEMRQFFDTSVEMLNSDKPRKFRVTVTYDWEGGKGEVQTFDIDLDRFYNLVLPDKTVAEVLDEMREDLHELSQALSGVVNMRKLRIEYYRPKPISRAPISSQHTSTQANPTATDQPTKTSVVQRNQTAGEPADDSTDQSAI